MSNKSVHVIGGGIIGLTTAWYLTQEGVNVTVIERNSFDDSTSHGNAGMIVPSHFVPMAAPGVISQGIKWMFNSKSPFYVRPKLSLDLIQWLWHFYRSCKREKVEQAMPILYDFNAWSKDLYQEFSEHSDFNFCFEKKGLLMLYRSVQQAHEEEEMAEKAYQLGITAQVMNSSELNKVEPHIKLDVLGGVYFPGDAHLYPNMFIKQLVDSLRQMGVQIIQESPDCRLISHGNTITSIQLGNRTEQVEQVLVSSGVWSADILSKLGIKIHLQEGKGYSHTIQDAPIKPEIPTILTEAKVAITPMGNDLRIGGTLELGNRSTTINKNRVAGIMESVPKYYPELQVHTPDANQLWTGYRPCTPDGMPYIGRTTSYQNLFVATGHGMMGMSLGPATGKLISQVICGYNPTIPLASFAVERKF